MIATLTSVAGVSAVAVMLSSLGVGSGALVTYP
jgi:hypothetical protein